MAVGVESESELESGTAAGLAAAADGIASSLLVAELADAPVGLCLQARYEQIVGGKQRKLPCMVQAYMQPHRSPRCGINQEMTSTTCAD